MVKTIAVMTSGGDAPGMNAAIRAVVRRGLDCGLAVYGIFNGYEGLVQGGEALRLLRWDDVGGVLQKGGTFLGTARSERFRTREGRRQAVLHLLQRGVEALVVIGGDGSLMGAQVLASEWAEHVAQIQEGSTPQEITVENRPGIAGHRSSRFHRQRSLRDRYVHWGRHRPEPYCAGTRQPQLDCGFPSAHLCGGDHGAALRLSGFALVACRRHLLGARTRGRNGLALAPKDGGGGGSSAPHRPGASDGDCRGRSQTRRRTADPLGGDQDHPQRPTRY